MASSAMETCKSEDLHMQVDIEKNAKDIRSQWVLNAHEPPSPWRVVADSVSKTISHYKHKLSSLIDQPCTTLLLSVLQVVFPILASGRNYTATKFRKDLLAGLTIASLCIPQSIGYATLAHLDPQYGLYTSVVPPLIYAVMGTSREIAIGPVAVVSLLLSSMMEKLVDPATDPVGYTKLILLATLFAGIFQTSFGLLRLGFLVDFLSHAAIWNPRNFILGCSFLVFILTTRFLGKRKKKLFWLASISPLVSVVVSTLIVFITRADKNGVKIVKHVKGGLNPSSIHQLDFNNPYIGEVAKIGLVVAVVALTVTILASVILSALPGLIDLSEAYKIWKVDKIDFLACAGAFFGVLFASVEIGLLAAGTQRFLQRLELYASVVMGLEAPALVNGQNLAITYNVFLGNHTIFETEPFLDVMVKTELLSESTAFHVQSLDSVHMNF
ncbi:low affinity sulfate transporter 3 [Glycine max]|nr:low affinity sulfate transporter 3 [Glycine max]